MGDTPQQDGTEHQDVERRQRRDRGASLVEYALLVSLIALVCAGALGYFQRETQQSFSESASHIEYAGK